jgi:hypothetical protein
VQEKKSRRDFTTLCCITHLEEPREKKKEAVTHPKESITILRKPVHKLSTLSIQPIDQEPVEKRGMQQPRLQERIQEGCRSDQLIEDANLSTRSHQIYPVQVHPLPYTPS